ncbi:glycosyltransferase [Butyrivibrio sp. MB2005]|uniref:glycosyltransferase n=1 Tax=Butyrivibrio sp. MB2005 TaxID=1280678 RepID=UPI0004177188|nr:glycosyltransferase [Butyrivibrio sp. MB2005]
MKILFHLNSMGRGGAEHVVSILSGKFADAGHDVIVATQWFSENEYKLSSKVRRISVGLTENEEKAGRIKKAFTRLFKLRNCVKKEKPDLVISFCAKANFRSAFSLFGTRTPLIVSVRNNPEVDYAPHKLATRYMEKKAVGCVFQTPDAMHYFSEDFQKRSTIIFNPIDENYLNADTNSSEGRVDNSKKIVNVGRISDQKNQLLLLKAFNNITKDYPDYSLYIYGDSQEGGILDGLTSYIRENHLEEKVFILPPSSNLKNEIIGSAMFVLSSDFEGMPNALIEAMALGIPSISTDCPCGGSRMLIDDGKSGILTPVCDEKALTDAMLRILNSKEFADTLGNNAKNVVSKVNPDKICKEWEDFINTKLKNKRA